MAATASFNVGGQLFTTAKETILKEPSSQLALVVRGVAPSKQDVNGAHFIDRDPKHFPLILNWLRDGWCALPSTAEARTELALEARHYHLTGLEAWMRAQELHESPSPSQTLLLHDATPLAHTTHTTGSLPHASIPAVRLNPSLSLSQGSPSHVRTPSVPLPGLTQSPQRAGSLGRVYGVGSVVDSVGFGGSPGAAPGSAVCAMQSPSQGVMTDSPSGGITSVTTRLREAFLSATAPPPGPSPSPGLSLQQGVEGTTKWSSKYLTTNDTVKQAVNTLLEVAYCAPHATLTSGKVEVCVSPCQCEHPSKTAATAASSPSGYMCRTKAMRVSAQCQGSGAWRCEFTVRASEPEHTELVERYAKLPEAVKDNWFVITAILKDQFGIRLEDSTASAASTGVGAATGLLHRGDTHTQQGPVDLLDDAKRAACGVCKQLTLAVSLHKVV